MLGFILKKIFGSHNERQVKKYWTVVHEINRYFEEFDRLTDEQIQAKTWEFRQRLQDGESLNSLLPEAFATVKQACKRHVGKQWMAGSTQIDWVEVPYDVQLIGGIVLHEGKISEMCTGEGKTLVAILPLYLNALEGRGCHLVTVNDYLAQRDSKWTGHILTWLGISVGCILQDMDPTERREQYACDVTYGQNSEFGFDYLRDNMTSTAGHLVQGARSITSQHIADEILTDVTANAGRVVADSFQTLIVEVTPQQAVTLIGKFGGRFSLDEIVLNWPGTSAGLALPSKPPRCAPLEETFDNRFVPTDKVWLRFQFFARNHHYAIVDEVDSILIDEARTPLIISGQVDRSTQRFEKMRPFVEELVQRQSFLVNRMLSEAEELLKKDDAESRYQGGMKLLQVKKAMPKNKRLLKYNSEPEISRLITKCENDFILDQKSKMGEKSMGWVEEELFFVIDEKGHSVDLTEQGRATVSPDNPDRFLLADMVDEFSVIEGNKELSIEAREELKAKVREENEIKSEELHNIAQLLRAYTLFEKDVEYVVQDNKVVIVDEFTGRLQAGRRYSDGLHQAIEAKERVKIEKETQTLATITIQNYFRMYKKMSGMTGTAETEAAEFGHTYKMDVCVIPTNRPIRRRDMDDVIYRTRREKFNAVVQEIVRLHEQKLPVLVGTVSVETSELLSRMLKRAGVSHSVLNAKYHEQEAEIVRDAGQPGAVTIATNMAGRGTDIKLGPGVIHTTPDGELDPEEAGGLQVIGTERHESRRIDRQLRGRSGRQGDPGATQFFLSLEDDLMRLFGSERIASIMQRLGLEEGEDIRHPFITGAISRAQRRIEEINFERRKKTLDYDNVMNKQRETLYGLRREVLISENLRQTILDLCFDALSAKVDEFKNEQTMEHAGKPYNLDAFEGYVHYAIPGINLDGIEQPFEPNEDYLSAIIERAGDVYNLKAEMLGPELSLELSRYIILQSIDNEWRDHLRGIDELREGIHLRSYAQLDPLVEYQREATYMFQDMMGDIQRMVLEHFFRANVVVEPQQQTANVSYQHEEAASALAAQPDPAQEAVTNSPDTPPKQQPYHREMPKVGRNDPCPCGSGKKYKKCCGEEKL